MKQSKFLCLMLSLALMAALLAGCACQHEWTEADCKAPKTCTLCGETEGETTNDHQWEDATTEAPKTCSVCGLTEGEKINVDSRFTTAACKELFGTWTGSVSMSAAEMGLTGDCILSISMTYTFTNDGKMECKVALADIDGYKQMIMDALYAQFAAQGMSQAEADAAMQQTYGMSTEEYAAQVAQTTADTYAAMSVDMVYYVADGQIYSGLNWESEMTGDEYSIENGKLHMIDDGQDLELTRVEE